ncbi:hypothetical protein [Salinibius halmophilus]|uniref:hypothetical protein n=1 Tax=Salinibius halmophilus TaxID=1853216 RepID=UPI000E66D324|nr:hypothetical protein [Salinibius halmophilus]
MTSVLALPKMALVSNSRYCWLTLCLALFYIYLSAFAGVASYYTELYAFAMLFWAYQYQVIQLRKSATLVFVPGLFQQYFNACFGQLYLLILLKFIVTWQTTSFADAVAITGWLLLLHLGMAWGGVKSNVASQWPIYALIPLLLLEINVVDYWRWPSAMLLLIIVATALSHIKICRLHQQRVNQGTDLDHYEWRWLPATTNTNVILLNPLLRYAIWGKHAAVAGVMLVALFVGLSFPMISTVRELGWAPSDGWFIGSWFILIACSVLPNTSEQITKIWQLLPISRAKIIQQLTITFIGLLLVQPFIMLVAWLVLPTPENFAVILPSLAITSIFSCVMLAWALIPTENRLWLISVKFIGSGVLLFGFIVLNTTYPMLFAILGAISVPAAVLLHSRWRQKLL